jgi:hypothetical protein
MKASNTKPSSAHLHLGHLGVVQDVPGLSIEQRGNEIRLSEQKIKLLIRRQVIQPIIGHLDEDPQTYWCNLKG